MGFRATPSNVIELLLISFAVCVLYFLSKKRLDSNLPLVFYGLVFAFIRYSDYNLPPHLFFAGVILAMLLRFEFLSQFLTNLAWGLEIIAIGGIALNFLSDAFDLRF